MSKTTKTKMRIVEANPVTFALVPVHQIQIPENVREPGWEGNLDELVNSIRASGLKQPIGVWPLVKPTVNGETHTLVWGWRRLAACKQIGWNEIPVVYEPGEITPQERFMSALAENSARVGITPYEEALAFKRATEEFKMTATQISHCRGVTVGYVSQRLALLKMSDDTVEAVRGGDIKLTHVRELGRLPKDQQAKFLKVAKRLPAGELRDRVAQFLDAQQDQDLDRPKRGRPLKGAKDGKDGKVRTVSEIKAELRKLEDRQKTIDSKDDGMEKYLAGLVQGLGWAAGFTPNLF